MKKLIAVIVIFVCIGSALSAQITMSAGGGFLFDGNYGNGYERTTDQLDFITNKNVPTTEKMGTSITSIGAYAFFDATYVEASVYFALGFPSAYSETRTDNYYGYGGLSITGYSMLELGFTVLGKYPLLEMGPLSLFPLLGVSYNMVLSYTDKDGKNLIDIYDGKKYEAGSYSQFGILAGVGADFDINRNLYVRGEALFHLRLASENSSAEVDSYNKYVGSAPKYNATLGIGPQIRVGVGYRF